MNLEKEFRFRFVLQTEKETYEQQFNLKKNHGHLYTTYIRNWPFKNESVSPVK